MCGRFTINFGIEEVQTRFKVQKVLDKFAPSYNVAPMQAIPVIYNDNGIVTLDVYRWGLIPHWANGQKVAYKMINARIETLREKHTYNKELKEGRCLIPASGFFEWKKGKNEKIPQFIFLKNKDILAFAGISSRWAAPDGKILKTCLIVTLPPNSYLAKTHDRMPSILPKKLENEWISQKHHDKDEILKLLRPIAASEINSYAVSTFVNSPKNNSPECIEAI